MGEKKRSPLCIFFPTYRLLLGYFFLFFSVSFFFILERGIGLFLPSSFLSLLSPSLQNMCKSPGGLVSLSNHRSLCLKRKGRQGVGGEEKSGAVNRGEERGGEDRGTKWCITLTGLSRSFLGCTHTNTQVAEWVVHCVGM